MAIHTNAVADTKSDLYATIPSDGTVVTLNGDLTRGDIIAVDYLYDSSSTVLDNYPDVIKPTLQTGSGSWLKQLHQQYQSDWDQSDDQSMDYIKNKPSLSDKRQETYSGNSNSSGVYTVTFANSFSVAPNIHANIVNQSSIDQFLRITSISTTGFTINVFERTPVTVLGISLLPGSGSNLNGASIDVIVTEK